MYWYKKFQKYNEAIRISKTGIIKQASITKLNLLANYLSPTAAQEWKCWYKTFHNFIEAIRISKRVITEQACSRKLTLLINLSIANYCSRMKVLLQEISKFYMSEENYILLLFPLESFRTFKGIVCVNN